MRKLKCLKNALISTGEGNEQEIADIYFDNKIQDIGSSRENNSKIEIIDLKGKLVIPGCIDAHVHFNDPGYNRREDFISGTTAAACGGITTIADMPCTSIPPVTNKGNLHRKLNVIKNKSLIDFSLWGGIRSNDLPFSEQKIDELRREGIVGLKIYTISGMESFGALSYDQIAEQLQKDHEILFAFHAEDREIIENACSDINPAEKRKPENYLKMRPAEAESKAVRKILNLNRNNRIHFVHISSANAAKSIIESKEKNDVSFETCPHYLQFTVDDLPILKGRIKTAPSVKYDNDKHFLRRLLKAGKVDYIATDHAGCDYEKEKKYADFSKVYNGIPGTELMIPYLFSEFYIKENVPLSTMIDLTSKNAAGRLGMFPEKGSLQIGSDADFTIIDLNRKFIVEESNLHSLGKYSPFTGMEFSCSIDKTIVRGEVVYDREKGICVEPGYGKWIRRISRNKKLPKI